MISTTHYANEVSTHRRQRGAALLIALVVLLATTLLGVTIARMTTLQERMAGNLRQQALGFEGAEAMLREGEEWLEDQTGATTRPQPEPANTCGSPPCDVLASGPNALDPLADTTWNGSDVRNGDALQGTDSTQFYIQEGQVLPDSLNVEDTGERVYYFVVGRATNDVGSDAILRSEFAVRY